MVNCGKGDIPPHIIIVTYAGIFFNAFCVFFCPIFAKITQKYSPKSAPTSKRPFFSRFGAKIKGPAYRDTLLGVDKNEKRGIRNEKWGSCRDDHWSSVLGLCTVLRTGNARPYALAPRWDRHRRGGALSPPARVSIHPMGGHRGPPLRSRTDFDRHRRAGACSRRPFFHIYTPPSRRTTEKPLHNPIPFLIFVFYREFCGCAAKSRRTSP